MTEKKTVTVKPAAKAVAATKTAADKAVEAKKETVEAVKVAPVKKEEVKAAPAKKAAEVKKEAVKKAPAEKKVEKKPVAKKETVKKVAKSVVTLEYRGNSYTEESLVQSAKDVWVYDLGKDLKDFKSVELYVKPEENTVYYVVNKEVKGGFAL